MTNYVLTWKSRDNDGTVYFNDSENTPTVYLMHSTDQLGEAKVFPRLSDAEFERNLVVRFSEEMATTIEVSNRELFEARLKGE